LDGDKDGESETCMKPIVDSQEIDSTNEKFNGDSEQFTLRRKRVMQALLNASHRSIQSDGWEAGDEFADKHESMLVANRKPEITNKNKTKLKSGRAEYSKCG
jgi:hypothetical protein